MRGDLWVPNPAIIGVMTTFTGVSLFSAGMTPFTTRVTGSVTGVVSPVLTKDDVAVSVNSRTGSVRERQ